MLKRLISVLIGFAIATSVNASGPINEILESDGKDKQPQLAVTDKSECVGFSSLDRDLLQLVGTYLDPNSLSRMLIVNRFTRSHRNIILIRLLPLMYHKMGVNYEDAFAKLDHPDWKPNDLPDNIKIKLHYGWYLKAVQMRLVDQQMAEEERKYAEDLRQREDDLRASWKALHDSQCALSAQITSMHTRLLATSSSEEKERLRTSWLAAIVQSQEAHKRGNAILASLDELRQEQGEYEKYRKDAKEKRKQENAVRQFKLFYQAGCLGHMLAAEQAGLMLFDPSLNNVIPVVITYDDLDPDARTWDVKRLNKEFLDPRFMAAIEALEYSDRFAHEADAQARLESVCKMLEEGQIQDPAERRVLEAGIRRSAALINTLDLSSSRSNSNSSSGESTDDDSEGEDSSSEISDLFSQYEKEYEELLRQVDSNSSVNLQFLQCHQAYKDVRDKNVDPHESDAAKIFFNFYKRFLHYRTLEMRNSMCRPVRRSIFAYNESRLVSALLGSRVQRADWFYPCDTFLLDEPYLSMKRKDALIELARKGRAIAARIMFLRHLEVTRNPDENRMINYKTNPECENIFLEYNFFINPDIFSEFGNWLANNERFELMKQSVTEKLG